MNTLQFKIFGNYKNSNIIVNSVDEIKIIKDIIHRLYCYSLVEKTYDPLRDSDYYLINEYRVPGEEDKYVRILKLRTTVTNYIELGGEIVHKQFYTKSGDDITYSDFIKEICNFVYGNLGIPEDYYLDTSIEFFNEQKDTANYILDPGSAEYLDLGIEFIKEFDKVLDIEYLASIRKDVITLKSILNGLTAEKAKLQTCTVFSKEDILKLAYAA